MISIVAAIGKNRELGKDNKLLWNIPEDLRHFKEVTSGHVVIMGRKTFESIGRVLPNRLNIIISRDSTYKTVILGRSGATTPESKKDPGQARMTNVEVVHSLDEAIEIAKKSLKTNDNRDEVFIIGGGQIFAEVLSVVDKLYLTIVDAAFDADVFFPDYSMFTKVIKKEDHESCGYRYSFVTLEK